MERKIKNDNVESVPQNGHYGTDSTRADLRIGLYGIGLYGKGLYKKERRL